ncbi:WD40-repeat-containing domain [Pseudocohnilembus persalinus]|uniref:WD40-repeat-containing domain n=1 Tax=Pseudocohnilembus persalinus TaxID=266149 RepID=A0A0V0QVQ4_PSEPJ|nr:WD40-repeat-containing domain [Pseudocohnilembus persalinus]|eukprot:KRX06457.1 WD40-repeat-containing domain [Pseudocohnilembus persalinus]
MEENKSNQKFKQQFCVHLGTYDGSILGFLGNLQQLESRYSYSVSPGSIKSILTVGRYLFVAGFDEIIRIYDTFKFKEVGNLDGHQGSILTMEAHQNVLLSSGDDGQIMTWKLKEWSLITRLKAHETTIYDICLHPSGKILISISKDNRMFVWNLINGQKAYQRRFPYNLNKVMMLDEGKYICLLSDYNVHIIDSKTNQEVDLLKNEDCKVNDFIAYKKFIIVGDEKGHINMWDPNFSEKQKDEDMKNEDPTQNTENNSKSSRIRFKAHSNRVKAIRIAKINGVDFLITVSSSGELKIWDCLEGILNQIGSIYDSKDFENGVKPVYQIFTNQRITSMAVTVYEEQGDQQQKQQEVKEQNEQEKEIKQAKKEQRQQEIAENNDRKQQDPSKPRSILKKKISKQVQIEQNQKQQQGQAKNKNKKAQLQKQKQQQQQGQGKNKKQNKPQQQQQQQKKVVQGDQQEKQKQQQQNSQQVKTINPNAPQFNKNQKKKNNNNSNNFNKKKNKFQNKNKK